jgi:hypothetical protein
MLLQLQRYFGIGEAFPGSAKTISKSGEPPSTNSPSSRHALMRHAGGPS